MPTVRAARPGDAPALARVHVLAWQETYRGLMDDAVLDAPDAAERRERMWTRILTDDAGPWRAAVAEHDGDVVGFALTTDADREPDVDVERMLSAIYLLRAHHGSGAGQALLDAVLDPHETAVLWVADPNPRARRFYERAGFRADGIVKDEDGVREVRLVRR